MQTTAPPGIRRRKFGRAAFEVSELSLGTWGLSGDAYGPVYHKEVDRVIERAVEAGITLFETADVYGNGEMETKLGALLKDKPHVRIATKLGTFRDEGQAHKRFDPDSLRIAFDKSRERLGKEKLDIVILHNPTATTVHRGHATDFLVEKVKAGELEAWGVSAGDWEVASAAIQRRADVVELAYNVLHQKDLHRIAGEVASTETAVLARSVLGHGLLAGIWSRTRKFFDNDHRHKRWPEGTLGYRIDQLEAVKSLMVGEVATLRGAALRFVLSNAMVSSAVLGPRSVTQLNQLLREAGKEPPYLDDEALIELPLRLEAVGVQL